VAQYAGGGVMAFGFLASALVCTAFAQFSYKLYFVKQRPRPALLCALVLFAIAQLGFFLALTQLAIGVVYMSTGITQVLVLALSRYALRENVTHDHLIAVLLIIGGLVVYAG